MGKVKARLLSFLRRMTGNKVTVLAPETLFRNAVRDLGYVYIRRPIV